MPTFISIISSFPTAVFTVMLGVSVVYWLVSLSGMVEGDVGDGDPSDGASLGGLLATLGLQGVPLPLALTLLALSGWLFCYFVELWLGTRNGPGWWQWGFGALLLLVALGLGILLTAMLVRPLRPLFRRAYRQPAEQRLIGGLCTVRSASVGKSNGRADAHVDGDHLILEVRSDKPLVRGDRAVVIDYLPDDQAYWVIPEKQFQSGLDG